MTRFATPSTIGAEALSVPSKSNWSCASPPDSIWRMNPLGMTMAALIFPRAKRALGLLQRCQLVPDLDLVVGAERRGDDVGFRRSVQIQDRRRDVAEFAGLQRLAEEDREDDRHHQDEDEAPPIAPDLAELLLGHVADDCKHPHHPEPPSGVVPVSLIVRVARNVRAPDTAPYTGGEGGVSTFGCTGGERPPPSLRDAVPGALTRYGEPHAPLSA